MSKQKKVQKKRCSQLPRLLKCSGSGVKPKISIEQEYEGANLGITVHAVLEDFIKGTSQDLPDMMPYYEKARLTDFSEFMGLCYAGKAAWEQFKPRIESILEVETAIEKIIRKDGKAVMLTGHPDCAFRGTDGSIIIFDWKSGYVESDVSDQLEGYASLLEELYPETETFVLIAVWLRSKTADIKTIDLKHLHEWEGELVSKANQTNEIAGEHCTYCDRAHECNTRKTYVQEACTDLIRPDFDPGILTAEGIAEIYPRFKIIKKAMNDLEKEIKSRVREVGKIPMKDGTYLGYRTETREDIDPLKAIHHMMSTYKMDMVEAVNVMCDGTLSIGKTAMLKRIGDAAPRGQKGKAKSKHMEELRALGAIEEKEIQKLAILKGATDE